MFKRILKAIKNPTLYHDDYLDLLKKASAGMLHHGNILCFDYAIKNLPSNNPIIEIGTFCGLSANAITYFKKIHSKNNILISTDKWPNADRCGLVAKSDITYHEFREYIRESLINNLLTFSKNDLPYAVENTSDTFFENWENKNIGHDIFGRNINLGGGISFAYIDGNHTYEYVHRDFINCDKYLDKGGFIFFDDSADFTDWEVRKVIKEVKNNNNYKIINKNPNYLFQKIN